MNDEKVFIEDLKVGAREVQKWATTPVEKNTMMIVISLLSLVEQQEKRIQQLEEKLKGQGA